MENLQYYYSIAFLDRTERTEKMKATHLLTSAVILFMLVFSSFSTAGAFQDTTAIDISSTGHDSSAQESDAPPTGIQGEPDPGISAILVPTPNSPSGYEIRKYPNYFFSKVEGAGQYQIKVYREFPSSDVFLFSLKAKPTCGTYECYFTPDVALKPFVITETTGRYGWKVRVKVDGEWGDWSGRAPFTVIKDGFDFDFSTLSKAWIAYTGNWTVNNAGYMKTTGVDDKLTSALEKHIIIPGIASFEVRMKRKNSDAFNFVYFSGYPTPLSATGGWKEGYYFSYSNNQVWVLGKTVNGVSSTISGGVSSAILPYDWNEVTIVRTDTDIWIWVNDTKLGTWPETTHQNGYVGFGMFKEAGEVSPLLVDWARMEYLDQLPSSIP